MLSFVFVFVACSNDEGKAENSSAVVEKSNVEDNSPDTVKADGQYNKVQSKSTDTAKPINGIASYVVSFGDESYLQQNYFLEEVVKDISNMEGCYDYEYDEELEGYRASWNGKGGTEGNLGVLPAPLTEYDGEPVKSYQSMFEDYDEITGMDLSRFDTKKIENMAYMFSRMGNLRSLNLASFDTSNVKNMDSMFYWLEEIKYLDLSSFNTSNVETMSSDVVQ